ncbi:hypothetical protein EGJ27_08250 [Pseudomonas sp. v388]|nr:hypothetical protein EGJ27_08250 [Pseudomonas sp. v388]
MLFSSFIAMSITSCYSGGCQGAASYSGESVCSAGFALEAWNRSVGEIAVQQTPDKEKPAMGERA